MHPRLMKVIDKDVVQKKLNKFNFKVFIKLPKMDNPKYWVQDVDQEYT